ncbi:MAG: hypothetical protein QNL04_13040 [SAR324 cluster bacterium]|nr:hypothetical protein [SAR324 cluster bacterium]
MAEEEEKRPTPPDLNKSEEEEAEPEEGSEDSEATSEENKKAETAAEGDTAEGEPPLPSESGPKTQLTDQEKEALMKEILSKETFIDPLDPELIVKAYSVYDTDPNKVIKALITSFQSYCKKAIREAAILRKKNHIAIATSEEAEQIRITAVKEINDSIAGDLSFERTLMKLIFKITYWNWLLFGLKDIFKEQRKLPGNPINNQLNIRFHKLKAEKGFKTVADLVIYDITDILNHFKAEITSKNLSIFG